MLWDAGVKLSIGKSFQAVAKTLGVETRKPLPNAPWVARVLKGLVRITLWGGDNLFESWRKRGQGNSMCKGTETKRPENGELSCNRAELSLWTNKKGHAHENLICWNTLESYQGSLHFRSHDSGGKKVIEVSLTVKAAFQFSVCWLISGIDNEVKKLSNKGPAKSKTDEQNFQQSWKTKMGSVLLRHSGLEEARHKEWQRKGAWRNKPSRLSSYFPQGIG